MVCICKPLTDSAAPASTAVIDLGSLKSRTMVFQTSLSALPKTDFNTSSQGMATEPKSKSKQKRTANSTTNPLKRAKFRRTIRLWVGVTNFIARVYSKPARDLGGGDEKS